MTKEVCDLCGQTILVGVEPTYGALGHPKKPETGPPLDKARHYKCHIEKFGRTKSWTEAKSDFDASLSRLKEQLDKIMTPGGTIDKLKGVLDEEAPATSTVPSSRGPCRYCGSYWFNHPTPNCPSWAAPLSEFES